MIEPCKNSTWHAIHWPEVGYIPDQYLAAPSIFYQVTAIANSADWDSKPTEEYQSYINVYHGCGSTRENWLPEDTTDFDEYGDFRGRI